MFTWQMLQGPIDRGGIPARYHYCNLILHAHSPTSCVGSATACDASSTSFSCAANAEKLSTAVATIAVATIAVVAAAAAIAATTATVGAAAAISAVTAITTTTHCSCRGGSAQRAVLARRAEQRTFTRRRPHPALRRHQRQRSAVAAVRGEWQVVFEHPRPLARLHHQHQRALPLPNDRFGFSHVDGHDVALLCLPRCQRAIKARVPRTAPCTERTEHTRRKQAPTCLAQCA